MSVALLAPYAVSFEPTLISYRTRLQAPSKTHIMGTDEFGRDVFSRVVYGLRTSVSIGLAVVAITGITGIVLGLITGYYPRFDRIFMRILDGWMAFPEIILAVTLAAVWGSGAYVIIFAMSFAYFPRMCRVVRSGVLRIKELDYIEATKALGARDPYILLRHVLPNCVSLILVQITFSFATAILAEAALSFLGVGIKPPAPSLGGMISDGRNFYPIAPWVVLSPGLVMVLLVLTLNLLGDRLRDALDPKQVLKKRDSLIKEEKNTSASKKRSL